jgi:hypothetical protein
MYGHFDEMRAESCILEILICTLCVCGRGENGPTCWVMQPIAGDENRCLFQWLLNVNLKGWLPHSVVDLALTTTMLEYMRYIRQYTQKLKQESQ